MKIKVGFVGLGHMGKWMAVNILKKGHHLWVHDIDQEAMKFLADQGARESKSPAQMAGEADFIFLSLPNAAVVEKVIFKEDGIVSKAKAGLIVIDCGTTAYMSTLDFGRRLEQKGVRFLDAPVSGMEKRAQDGRLTTMAGGEEEIFGKVKPVIEAYSDKVLFMGALGSGQLTKLINQLLFNISAAAIAEVLPMSVKLGLDPAKVTQVITSGTGRSFAAEFFAPLALEGRFDQGYPLEEAYKDMISAAEVCAHRKIPLPLVQAAATTYQMALAAGYGRESKGAMIKVFEGILGVKFRRPGA